MLWPCLIIVVPVAKIVLVAPIFLTHRCFVQVIGDAIPVEKNFVAFLIAVLVHDVPLPRHGAAALLKEDMNLIDSGFVLLE